MSFSPLAIKRSYILGKIANKCETVETLPVYENDITGEPIGFADESLGRYADAFLFHLPEDVCKRLASNGYELDVDYDIHERDETDNKVKRLKLNYIILKLRDAIPRRTPVKVAE